MKDWDVIIAGAGVIGLSLALSLRRHGARVLIVERGAAGREASYAAGGMLSGQGPESREPLQSLSVASALLYPEFVHELRDESKLKIQLRDHGTLLIGHSAVAGASALTPDSLQALEPHLEPISTAAWLPERCVDPREITNALVASVRHRGIDMATGNAAEKLLVERDQVAGVASRTTKFFASVVINCAGAWSGQFGPSRLPVKPIKGQMLALLPDNRGLIRHVVRTSDVYLIPRDNGKIIVGSTLEDSGFDKRVDPTIIQRLHQRAADLVPELGEARILEAWAGLRPATPDQLPILGATGPKGYFVATGHYRDGILLAPITALLMTQVIRGRQLALDIEPFSPDRFVSQAKQTRSG